MRPKLLFAGLFLFTSVLVMASPAPAQDDLALARKVAAANNAFGVALYREFAKEQKGNLVFSPFSLSSALALTATGARGQTEKELWQALCLDLPRETVAAGYAGGMASFARSMRDGAASVTVANSLWPRQGYVLEPEFLEVAHMQFSAEVTALDYAHPEAAAETINHWIESKTAGLIRNLISPEALSPQTRLTLCNAVHFKARWNKEFSPKATTPGRFSILDGAAVEVPMMKREGWFAVGELRGCRLLSMRYTRGDFEMVIVLPDQLSGLPWGEGGLDALLVQEWMKTLDAAKPQYTELSIPRFRATARPECLSALTRLGMRRATNSNDAELEGLSNKRGFSIGAVLHKTVIDVNEEGTEATAVTAMLMYGSSGFGQSTPKPFKVDHPFLFLIRETRTGAILFMGRIVDPRAE